MTIKGNRKLLVSGGALVMGFVLALFSKLTGDFVTIGTVTVGAFTAGNAYEHSRRPDG